MASSKKPTQYFIPKSKPLAYHLGNLLIILALLVFLFIYLPVLKLFFVPTIPKPALAEQFGEFLTIPKINAYSPIIEDVDPWKPEIYQEALKKGVAQAKDFSKPGEKGTIFLFAHSSDFIWRLTSYNTVFLRLGELSIGDQIIIEKDGKRHEYKVREKKEVWPSEVQVVTESTADQLILQTCTPIGTALRRLLVFADPVS